MRDLLWRQDAISEQLGDDGPRPSPDDDDDALDEAERARRDRLRAERQTLDDEIAAVAKQMEAAGNPWRGY